MPGRRTLRRILFPSWPDMQALADEWKAFMERLDSWSWGPGFDVHDGDGGRTVHFSPPSQVKYARTTTGGITARSGSTLGVGSIVIEERTGAAVADGAAVTCYSTFAAAVAHPSNLMVMRDGTAYALVSVECPPA